MDRRQFVKTGVAAATVVATGLEAEAQSVKPPNILYIFADQHRSSSMQALQGGTTGEQSDIQTPNLNAFRSAGFTMQNCYTNYPLCSPHRAMLQTGIWPQKNGVTGNVILNGTTQQQNNIKQLNTANTTVAQVLQTNANYYTGYVGKWDLGPDTNGFPAKANAVRFNYDEWMPWYNTNSHYVGAAGWTPNDGNTVAKGNSAFYYDPATSSLAFVFPYGSQTPNQAKGQWNPHYQTLQAKDFITRNASNTKPWLLFVSYNVPHPPYNPPNGNGTNGYPEYNESQQPVLRTNVDVSTNGNLPDASLLQVYNVNDPASWSDPTQNGAKPLQNAATIKTATWNYYEGVSDVDTEVQVLLNAIASDPDLASNTVIIYTSDHGDMLGSHTLVDKQFPHEESSSVPFYAGGKINGTAISGSYSGLFATIDIAPTLCGLAGVTPPSSFDGKNFAPVIKGNVTDIPHPNQYVFLLNGHGDPSNGNGDSSLDGYWACPVYRGLRSARYTYACVASGNIQAFHVTGANHANVGPYKEGHWVLYDNQNDAYQETNLITSNVASGYPTSGTVPAFSDLKTALNAFITANGGGSFGDDAFTSPVLS
jgi:arylsulfatase A-like enzyme